MSNIVEELVNAVKGIAGEKYQVRKENIMKNTGVELQAIIISADGDRVSPTVYVDKYITDILMGKRTVTDAAEEIFKTYLENKKVNFGVDISKLISKEFILDHVEFQLVNAASNKDYLQKAPNKKIMDLAALYKVKFKNCSYLLTCEKMAIAGISVDELEKAAVRNTEKVGFIKKTMAQVMAEDLDMPEEDVAEMEEGPQLYVLTNKRKVNGANILLFKGELAEFAEMIGDDFFILPSSIHEVLAVPASQVDYKELKHMVKDVNDTQVAPNEILGYEVYRYDRKTRSLSIAA